MKCPPLDPELFVGNRGRLVGAMAQGSLAVVNSNDPQPSNADGILGFRQNSDLFYLTGVDQEETTLVLFPGAAREEMREVLFLRETNEHIALWEGEKLTKEQARQRTGIKTVYWSHQFWSVVRPLLMECESVYLNSNEHARAGEEVETLALRFIHEFKRRYPLHPLRRLAPLVYPLRAVKSPEERRVLQKASEITRDGFLRVLRCLRPGMMEYEIEAEMLHEYLRRGAEGFAYSPIVGSGKRACILHYLENNQVCQEGELVLMDAAACYGYYNADLTRTIPVSGRFSERQRAVYDAVLRVFREACQILRPGVVLREYQKEVEKVMASELVGLGLLTKEEVEQAPADKPAVKKFFMHGTSHLLGLDVHDVGPADIVVKKGMVFTVEPGIYLPEESLGVRLENNIVIEADGFTDLMADIPIEAEEIETLMHS
ncbi:MAG: aminopeptidase P N-terminal domain-containing protein [Verrucomicrobiota bacterium]